jgi:hypothetical protein
VRCVKRRVEKKDRRVSTSQHKKSRGWLSTVMTENGLDAGTKAGAWAGGNSGGTWWYLTGTRGWPITFWSCGSKGPQRFFLRPPALQPRVDEIWNSTSHIHLTLLFCEYSALVPANPAMILTMETLSSRFTSSSVQNSNLPAVGREPVPRFPGSQVHCRSFTRHTALFFFFCAL